MKKICFYFQVHQPFRLRQYRFFDIGHDHSYFDEHENRTVLQKVAKKCYLPTNRILLDLIREYGNRFKVSFSLSGAVLDQFELYAPEVLESFQELADTGCVEFLGETYAHSLSSLVSPDEFQRQVKDHTAKIEFLFGQKPKVFRNTELIYSDKISEMVSGMGFRAMLAEGAGHVLGWRSPNFLYCSVPDPRLRLLLKNYRLSDDIAFRFSQTSWNGWPLTAEKYVNWLNAIPKEEEIVNLFMDYETFGEHQWAETGIFEFLRALPQHIFSSSEYSFVTPSEAIEQLQPVAAIGMPDPVSWADIERNLSAWLGNDLQDDAFEALYRLEKKIRKIKDVRLLRDWKYLQTSDHFYYMCTKYFSDGDVHKYFNPYNTPYEAFINYMNVLSDFEHRVDEEYRRTEKPYRIPGRKRVAPVPAPLSDVVMN
ncbi:MAG TPA: glycoside hydrolase family 57 protein [Candidatus Kapabacteria bacterium]|nr:glycoside hydrolase family 57 protein [Candidatus Kapabacteria bacterium]